MAARTEDFTDQLRDRDDRVRRLEIDGKKYTLECQDPYGFWKIKMAQGGAMPECLKGVYTSMGLAEHSLRSYLQSTKFLDDKQAGEKAERIEAAIYKPTKTQKAKMKEEAEQA